MPKSKKAPSDSTMRNYWRRAVKSVHGNACVICRQTPVQCHHAVHRARAILRHDYRNGLPLCAECHNMADTILGRAEVAKHLDMEWLAKQERIVFKDYLVQKGKTRADFLNEQLATLKEVCENQREYRQ